MYEKICGSLKQKDIIHIQQYFKTHSNNFHAVFAICYKRLTELFRLNNFQVYAHILFIHIYILILQTDIYSNDLFYLE